MNGHLVMLAPLVARADRPPPRVRAVRVSQSPKLNGKLDDPAWRAALPVGSFIQKFPNEGAAPSEPTTIRVVYERDAVWIGVDCPQRLSAIVGRLTRRDRAIEADSITIGLDSRRCGTNAFEFSINAAGVLSDSIRFNDTDSSPDWDENWDARVATTPDGWSAEFRIPLRILRFDSLPVQSWGLQARRYISARQETDSTLYLVYTRSQAPDPTLMTGEFARFDIGAIRRGPVADVLLLKLTYWWG